MRYIIPILIFISGTILYSNTVHYPFHFDDELMILDNPRVRELSGFWPPSGQRYVGFLTLALNYRFGGLDTFGYHLVNIAIHSANAVLVYLLMLLTFRTPYLSKYIAGGIGRMPYAPTTHVSRLTLLSSFILHPSSFIPLFASLLFLAHPIQTQAVTYIIQRFASLATMFYLLALIFYIKARLNQPHPHPDPPLEWEGNKSPLPQVEGKGEGGVLFLTAHGSRLTALYYALSFLSTLLAMGSKETAVTLPVAVLLYEFFFFPASGKRLKALLYYFIPIFLTIAFIPLSLMNANRPLGELIGDMASATKETLFMSRSDYFLTQIRVIATYIRLLFLPVNQILDYDYPVYNSISNPAVFLSVLLHLYLIGLAVYLFKQSRKTGSGILLLISFGITLFYLTLSVESSIIPISDVIFEHRLYLPSVGAFMAAGTGLLYIFAHPHPSPLPDGEGAHLFPPLQGEGQGGDGADRYSRLTVFLISVILILFLLSAATVHRNLIWKSPLALWSDVVKKSPKKARGHNNLGNAYARMDLFDKAFAEYAIAVKISPQYAVTHSNMGEAYLKMGMVDQAIDEFKKALLIDPGQKKARQNLTDAYKLKTGGPDMKPVEAYKAALEKDPDNAEAHLRLGIAYDNLGMTEDAMREFLAALEIRPDYEEAHYNLGVAYDTLGRKDRAIREYKEAIRLKPDYVEAHVNLGVVYGQTRMIDDAISEFLKAVRLRPEDAEAHFNLSRAYKIKGDRDGARRHYREFLRYAPPDHPLRGETE